MNLSTEKLLPLLRQALERGEHVRMTATGSSMWPAIRAGDEVELVPLAAEPAPGEGRLPGNEIGQGLRRGDIVLIEIAPTSCLLHRVERLRAGQVWTRGDAVQMGEGPFPASRVLARVSLVYPQRGRPWRTDAGDGRLM
jgi:signal peptidase I